MRHGPDNADTVAIEAVQGGSHRARPRRTALDDQQGRFWQPRTPGPESIEHHLEVVERGASPGADDDRTGRKLELVPQPRNLRQRRGAETLEVDAEIDQVDSL